MGAWGLTLVPPTQLAPQASPGVLPLLGSPAPTTPCQIPSYGGEAAVALVAVMGLPVSPARLQAPPEGACQPL